MQILLGILDSIRRGISWATGTFTAQIFYGATYAPLANASFFAIGESISAASTTSYQYSTDGNTWVTGTLPASSRWSSIGTNGSRVIAMRQNASNGYYTDNGTTWTLAGAFPGGSYSPKAIIWDGTRFLATEGNTASSTGAVFYSTDGTSWSSATAGVASGSTFIGYDGVSRYIVTSVNDTTTLRTTTTFPTGWANASLPTTGRWSAPIYANAIWLIALPGSTTYATSTNGTTWTQRTLPSLFSETVNDRDSKFMFTGGKFYYYYADNIYSSADGITWATEGTVTGSTLDNLTGWAVGTNKVIGVGYDSTSASSGVYLNGSK